MSTTTVSQTSYRQESPAGELPILVGLLAIIIALFGLFFLVVGAVVLAAAFGYLVFPAAMAFSPFAGSLLFTGAVTLVFGAVLVSVATGLWDLELWALLLTGITIGVVIALLVLSASFGWGLLVAVALLIYLAAVSNHFY
jgi:hypothetical protein